jgi:hypothetical protein
MTHFLCSTTRKIPFPAFKSLKLSFLPCHLIGRSFGGKMKNLFLVPMTMKTWTKLKSDLGFGISMVGLTLETHLAGYQTVISVSSCLETGVFCDNWLRREDRYDGSISPYISHLFQKFSSCNCWHVWRGMCGPHFGRYRHARGDSGGPFIFEKTAKADSSGTGRQRDPLFWQLTHGHTRASMREYMCHVAGQSYEWVRSCELISISPVTFEPPTKKKRLIVWVVFSDLWFGSGGSFRSGGEVQFLEPIFGTQITGPYEYCIAPLGMCGVWGVDKTRTWADHMGVHTHGRTSENGSQRILREKVKNRGLSERFWPKGRNSSNPALVASVFWLRVSILILNLWLRVTQKTTFCE